MKHQLELVRDAILHSCYGKFDLVTDVIPKELLLTGKPRRVKKWLIQNLQLKDGDINSSTLRGWLLRYRNAQKKNVDSIESHQWHYFEPSMTKAKTDDEKIVIKKVSITKHADL